MVTRSTDQTEELVVSDPQAMRALAHPARLQVLEALREGQELTATQCAAATGLSPSAMSYHLRALEKWGFVVRGESGDARERPWRATARRLRFEQLPGGASAAAADATMGAMLERIRGAFAAWFEREGEQSGAWQDVGAATTSVLWLTAEEAVQLREAQQELLAPYDSRNRGERPADSRRVRLATFVVPLDASDPASA